MLKNKLNKILITIACIATVLILIDSFNFHDPITEYESYTINDNWQVYNGDYQLIDNNSSLNFMIDNNHNSFYLVRKFDQNYYPNQMLQLKVYEMNVWIYLDDQLIFKKEFIPTYINKSSPGAGLASINLPEDIIGKTLTIKYLKPQSLRNISPQAPIITKAASSNLFIQFDQMILIMINNALLLLAIVLFVLYILNKNNRRDISYLALATFFGSLAIWMFCYNNLSLLLSNNWVLIHNIEYMSLYLLPFGFWFYFLLTWNYRPYYAQAFLYINGGFYLFAVLAKLFVGFDFGEYLTIFHAMAIVNMCFVFYYLIRFYKSGSKSFKLFSIGIAIALSSLIPALAYQFLQFVPLYFNTLNILLLLLGLSLIAISHFYHILENINRDFELTVNQNMISEYERYETIISPTGNAFAIWNFIKDEVYVSSNFNQYFETNFTSTNFREPFYQLNIKYEDPNINLKQVLDNLMNDVDFDSIRCYFTTKSNIKKWFIIDLSTSLDANCNKANIFGMITDITREKELEQQYQRQQMNNDINKTLYDFVIEADISANKILNYKSNLTDDLDIFKNSYSRYVSHVAEHYVDDDYRQRILEILSIKNLTTNFINDHTNFDFEVMEIHDKQPIWYNYSAKLFASTLDNNINVIIYGKNINETKTRMLNLEQLVDKDLLTNSLNKTAFEQRSTLILNTKPDQMHALLIIDIDNFKQVNDTLGHVEGDRVICDFAYRLSQFFRVDDLIGRFGGDEFVVFMTNIHNYETLHKKVQSLLVHMQYTYHNYETNKKCKISPSIGVAIYPNNGDNYQKLFIKADDALYLTKRTGKNNFNISEK